MPFQPRPFSDLKPVEVTISLTASVHAAFERIGTRCGLSTSQTIEQFCTWGIEEKQIHDDQAKRGKSPKKNVTKSVHHD